MSDYAVLMFPFPMPLNMMFSNAGSRGRVKSRRYVNWIFEADLHAMQQKPLPRFLGEVEIIIKLGKPDKRRRDLDGLAKGILDRLTEWGVIEDDSLVQRLSMEWTSDVVGAQVEVMSFGKDEV